VVTNSKFASHFQRWADNYRANKTPLDFTIVNDGSTDDANKLGAIGDIHFVLNHESVDEDLIIVAGDNLFNKQLGDFGRFSRAKQAPVVGAYDVQDLELVKRYNLLELASDGRIVRFEEKPARAAGTLVAIALYYYPRHILPLIDRYLAEGNNSDQPGRLIQWLYLRVPVYTWRVPGLWFDIGSKESLAEANRVFGQPEPSGRAE
jgi:glucose-1-phosphate thymidylyltransferase